jgi:adenylate cyclase
VGGRANAIWQAASDVLLGRAELRPADVPSLAGAVAEDARRFWQALGFPAVPDHERAFTRADVEALQFVADLTRNDDPGRETMLQMTRATGQSLSRVARMHVSTMAPRIEETVRAGELSDSQAADRVAELAETLLRSHEPFLGYIWRRHVLAAISQVGAGASEHGAEVESEVIGFADLVDFTAASQQLTTDELAEVVDRFERIAYQEIPDRGGRVVKTLGDEVMFTNANVHAAADTALALAAACKAEDSLPNVRVGLAIGPMLAWEGDLYGPTVNMAHRLVGVARPGTVIVSDVLAERLADDEDFALVEIRDVKLKGIGKTKPWVLRQRASF